MILSQPTQQEFAIGQLADLTDCQVVTIRYYERVGMLPQPKRNAGGHRVYDRSHLERLSFIRKARELGFTQEAVRSLLDLTRQAQDRSCADVDAIALKHLADVREKMENLREMEQQLEDVLQRCGHSTLDACRVLEALRA